MRRCSRIASLPTGAGASAVPALALALAVSGGADPVAAGADAEAERGARVYAAACAACHGASREGAPRWWEAGADGRVPAPPLDGSGHDWQHSDAELIGFVARGVAAVPDRPSGMPAFAGRLDEAEIRAVVAFLKSRWPEGVRAAQAALNPGADEALADLLREGGDWTFPPDCLDPAERAAARAASAAGR